MKKFRRSTRNKKIINLFFVTLILFFSIEISPRLASLNQNQRSILPNIDYFGQTLPDSKPLPFGRGILNNEKIWPHSAPIFSFDGKEVYFSVFYPEEIKKPKDILYMTYENGIWSKPKKVFFSSDHSDDCPIFSPDGKRIYFSSNRPINASKKTMRYNIWYVEKKNKIWSEPVCLWNAINSDVKNLYNPVLTKSGNLYFSGNIKTFDPDHDIFVAKPINGEYSQALNLGSSINSSLHESWFYVDPDEIYLIFYSGTQGKGSSLYISFRNKNGTWSKRKSMGDIVNSRGIRMPMLSPDGKYLFFQGGDGCWWIDAKIIDHLRTHDLDFISSLISTVKEKGIKQAVQHFYQLKELNTDYFDLNEKILNNTGYKFLHYKNYEHACIVFQLNAALYPNSFNVYDSLGEALMLLGDNIGALNNYKKSIHLNPENKNALKMIEKLKNRKKEEGKNDLKN